MHHKYSGALRIYYLVSSVSGALGEERSKFNYLSVQYVIPVSPAGAQAHGPRLEMLVFQ